MRILAIVCGRADLRRRLGARMRCHEVGRLSDQARGCRRAEHATGTDHPAEREEGLSG